MSNTSRKTRILSQINGWLLVETGGFYEFGTLPELSSLYGPPVNQSGSYAEVCDELTRWMAEIDHDNPSALEWESEFVRILQDKKGV